MPRHDDAVSLRQMLDFACEAASLAQQHTRAEVDSDRVLGLALLQLLLLLGEAASRVSPERRARHPDIPWGQIVALRNRLIHGYDVIDYDILWKIITSDLPPLIASLEKAASAEG